MKSAEASIEVAKKIIGFPEKRKLREKPELAFLPAALEIVETPPSPVGRAIIASITALFALALIWACYGQVDIVAFATGKVVPSGRVKLIQPLETGVVRAIHVRDGQRVQAGDVLIELDPTMTKAEEEHIRSDLISARLDVARLRAALSDSDDSQATFQPPEGASSELVAMERGFLLRQTEEHRAKLGSLNDQRAQKEAERDTTAATIAKLEATEPIIHQRVEILRVLSDKGLGSKLTFLELLQLLTENQNDTAIQRSRLEEAKAALAAITDTRDQAKAEYYRTLFSDLAEAQRKSADLSDDLVKAEERTKRQALTAPVDGFVQQLAVHTVGGVVTPAQQLAVVVPSDAGLEVEAMISNRDVGFVHVGQSAQIKIDTFNFTRYGMLQGLVLSVTHDAVARDVQQDKAQNARDGASSEPKGQELNYVARVSLDKTEMQLEATTADLSPGMAVTVEIRTGTRRIISYILSPLMKYRSEALRER